MNCDSSTSICWPCQSTVRVPGRSVVSARHGLPWSLPRRTTERRLPIGKSGFVISVGFENEGTARSTRWRSDASLSRVIGLSLPSGGCGIVCEAEVAASEPPPSLQAPTVSAAATAAAPMLRIFCVVCMECLISLAGRPPAPF